MCFRDLLSIIKPTPAANLPSVFVSGSPLRNQVNSFLDYLWFLFICGYCTAKLFILICFIQVCISSLLIILLRLLTFKVAISISSSYANFMVLRCVAGGRGSWAPRAWESLLFCLAFLLLSVLACCLFSTAMGLRRPLFVFLLSLIASGTPGRDSVSAGPKAAADPPYL